MKRLERMFILLALPWIDLVQYVRLLFTRSSSWRYAKASRKYPNYLLQGKASTICTYHAKQFCKGRGVDIGAGMWPFPGARSIEISAGENADSVKEEDGALDYVFSSHCLEHLDRWQDALLEWRRVLKPGGVLYLYLPHPASEIWRPETLVFHAWQPEPDALPKYLASIGFDIIENSLVPDCYFSFYVVARKR